MRSLSMRRFWLATWPRATVALCMPKHLPGTRLTRQMNSKQSTRSTELHNFVISGCAEGAAPGGGRSGSELKGPKVPFSAPKRGRPGAKGSF